MATKGKQVSATSNATVRRLVDECRTIDYFSLEDRNEKRMVTGHPTVITSVTIDGKMKIIRHYLGDRSAPPELTHEEMIDELLNTVHWTG